MLKHFLEQLMLSRRRKDARSGLASVALEQLEARQLLSAITVQYSASKDNTIYRHDPDASNGSGEYILAGAGSRGLVQFDVGIPSGSTVIDAVLTLHVLGSGGGNSSVSVHRITTPWGEAGSNAPGNETTGDRARQFDATWIYSSFEGELWSSAGGDFGGPSASSDVSGGGAFEWVGNGLIDDVQSWVDDPSANFGWLLNAAESLTSFISRNAPDNSLAPTLEITYEGPPLPPQFVEGRIWNDLNSDGIRNDSSVSELDLTIVNGNTYFNAFGGSEYWYRSQADSKWYFLKPDGSLTRWSGAGGSLTGTLAATLDPQYYQNPIRITQDSTGDDEPWLNGWTVQLIDADGIVIDSVLTAGRDSNGDGTTDPTLEGGWYSFQFPADSDYTVRTVIPDGWAKTGEISLTNSAPGEGAVTNLNLRFRNSFYENFGGLGERWMYSDDTGWYYITPAGALYRWNGKAVSESEPLTGTLIGNPGPSYFENPLTLADGFSEPTDNSNSSQVTRTDFGVALAQTVHGRVWLDFFPNGIRDNVELIPNHFVLYPSAPIGGDEEWFYDFENSDWYIINAEGEANYWGPHTNDNDNDFNRPGSGGSTFREFAEYTVEPWLNGRTVELVDNSGTVVATTVSRNVDLNGDGVIQPTIERGWYVFNNVPAGEYTLRTSDETGWQQTAPSSLEQSAAASIDQQFDFRTTASDFLNWGGQNERWIIDQNNRWYYVLEDGGVYLWTVGTNESTGGLSGSLVAQLTAEFYTDLTLITEPKPSGAIISVSPEEEAIQLLFGMHRILDQLP